MLIDSTENPHRDSRAIRKGSDLLDRAECDPPNPTACMEAMSCT